MSKQKKQVFSLFIFMLLACFLQAQDSIDLRNDHFAVRFKENGIARLVCSYDSFKTNYIRRDRVFGDMLIRYIDQGRVDSIQASVHAVNSYFEAGRKVMEKQPVTKTAKPLSLEQRFDLQGDSVTWHFVIRNTGSRPVTIQDWAIPFLFNARGGGDPIVLFEQQVAKHSFIAGAGSFVFWQRSSGIGPYLLMTPSYGTSPQYFDQQRFGRDGNVYQLFLHAAGVAGADAKKWNQPITSRVLAPGEELKQAFCFRWAKSYTHMRDLLYKGGGIDVRVNPGMTVPTNLPVQIALRTKWQIDSIIPVKGKAKLIRRAAQKNGYQLYDIRFSSLGEVPLRVYAKGVGYTQLDFFVTEPLDTLYRKRSRFLANSQQHRDSGKWYNGLISQWDMRTGKLRGPDDLDGMDGRLTYIVSCDDPGLCKAPFMAAKNAIDPDVSEINAIEYYIEHFVWGKLQRTDQENPYPYGVYGTPNWLVNRYDSIRRLNTVDKNQDKMHVWRSYDYPHIMMLYYHMYQIASWYPDKVKYLDAKGYFKRAVETAKAYFKYPYEILPWYETYKWGCYNELLLMDLMKEMRKQGYGADADWLQKEWEKKVKYFIYDDKYPFRSEYAVDATAFESTHAIAKYALSNKMQPDTNLWYDKNFSRWYSHQVIDERKHEDFMHRQMEANLASRGWLEPAYYYMGSDFRGSNDGYLLSYMAQMGGWAVLDYGLYYTKAYADYIQLGYASYLSSFALINSGNKETNYGYWFPGKENDGAAAWAYEPRLNARIWIGKSIQRGPWMYDGEIDLGFGGALRAAASIIVKDPVFGWVAYGGQLQEKQGLFTLIPRDGVRQKLYVRGDQFSIDVQLDRDVFAAEQPVRINPAKGEIGFMLENRSGLSHATTIHLQGMIKGRYELTTSAGTAKREINIDGNESQSITVELPVKGLGVTLKRIRK